MSLEFEELTGKIIGAAIEVHRKLGPGFVESAYENALVIEMTNRGLKFEQQKEVIIRFKGIDVGKHRLDLFAENEIVVDLKTVECLEDVHFAVVRSQLRVVNRRHGLLLNFAKVTLEAKRVIAS